MQIYAYVPAYTSNKTCHIKTNFELFLYKMNTNQRQGMLRQNGIHICTHIYIDRLKSNVVQKLLTPSNPQNVLNKRLHLFSKIINFVMSISIKTQTIFNMLS